MVCQNYIESEQLYKFNVGYPIPIPSLSPVWGLGMRLTLGYVDKSIHISFQYTRIMYTLSCMTVTEGVFHTLHVFIMHVCPPASRLDVGNLGILWQRASLHMQLGEQRRALEVFEQLLKVEQQAAWGQWHNFIECFCAHPCVGSATR